VRGYCSQATDPTPNAPVDIKCNNGVVTFVSGEVTVVGTPEVLTLTPTGQSAQTA